MLHEEQAGSAREWLRRAKSNLARAKQPKPPESLWEDLCFDAEQAAEKALKAVLILRGIEFPKTHNIRVLLDLLSAAGMAISPELREAVDLTIYATALRYPGDFEPATEADYRRAVESAELVVRWVENTLLEAPR
jgi:HEPN domain-containing protein